MKVGSLFSGIGGFDLGLERAGHEIAWQVEIDPFCQRVLTKHWPNVKRYSDVTLVGDELERVDIIAGGFPCQDISTAGKGVGIIGERSGLWREFARIIGKVRPKWVIAENVPTLRSRGLTLVLQDLGTLGYDAEWHCIPASAVGAPHQRDRIWIVAYAEGVQRDGGDVHGGGDCEVTSTVSKSGNRSAEESHSHTSSERLAGCRTSRRMGKEFSSIGYMGDNISDAEGVGCDIRAQNGDGESTLSNRERLLERTPNRRSLLQPWSPRSSWWDVEPNVGRVAHGVPARVDRLKSLGNALLPQIAEAIGRRLT